MAFVRHMHNNQKYVSGKFSYAIRIEWRSNKYSTLDISTVAHSIQNSRFAECLVVQYSTQLKWLIQTKKNGKIERCCGHNFGSKTLQTSRIAFSWPSIRVRIWLIPKRSVLCAPLNIWCFYFVFARISVVFISICVIISEPLTKTPNVPYTLS